LALRWVRGAQRKLGRAPQKRCCVGTERPGPLASKDPPGPQTCEKRGGWPDEYGGSGMNRKILLVDEWRAVRLLGRRVLSSLGFQTREARTGLEALEIFALEPDISGVLLEWKPQDQDCLELLRKLAAFPRQSRPAVIACGDVLDRSQILGALEAGADEFIHKPYSRETVLEKFAQLGVTGYADSPYTEMLSSAR
jgi:two-component system chemotaxis response regulator CheY